MKPVAAARMTKLIGLLGLETRPAIIAGVVVEVEAGPQAAPLVVAAVVPHRLQRHQGRQRHQGQGQGGHRHRRHRHLHLKPLRNKI